MAFEFRLPDIGEGLTQAEITEWLVEVGQEVALDQPLVEIETDKAVTEIPSPRAGVLTTQGAPVGAVVKVGEILAVIAGGDEEAPLVPPSAGRGSEPEPQAPLPIVGTIVDAPAPGARSATRPQVLPAVRKLAGELAVDLDGIAGTGPGGRITRQDVEEASRRPPEGRAREDEERVRLSKLSRTIAERMARSWREIPHVTTFGEAKADRLLDVRRRARREGDAVPLEAMFAALVVPALKEFPEFNATLDGDDLLLKRHYDVGIAVDTPDGLIVPVVKGADRVGMDELAAEVTRLMAAARDRTLSPHDLAGATFTISNIGAVGGGFGTPIIPWGTTAILSIGRATPRVVPAAAHEGRVEVASLLPLSLSYDHRVIDGALGRRFLAAVIEAIEAAGGIDG